MTSTDPDLTALGEDLEDAAERDLAAAHHRRKKLTIATAIGAITVIGASAAVVAATGVFDSDEVERGMPNGATMFQGTSPQCTEIEDGVVFRCYVPGGPQESVEQVPTYRQCNEIEEGGFRCGPVKNFEQPSYKGAIEVLSSDDLVVSGGCVGQDDAGTQWLCYVGQRAVDEGLVAQDFLGFHQPVAGGVG
jgi:hypothetical protein